MRNRLLAGLCVVGFLTACGGGGGSSSLPKTSGGPSTNPGTLDVSFRVPSAAQKAAIDQRMSSRRSPQYISPATNGFGINVVPGNGTISSDDRVSPTLAADVSTCLTNCVANADGSRTYTLAIPIAPGSYTVGITLWDRVPTSSVAPFTDVFAGANELSQSTDAVTVNTGTSTNLNVTLYGVPVSVSLVPAPNQSHVLADSATSGYEIVGKTPVRFFANAIDADGYVIAGTGSDIPLVQLSDGSGNLAILPDGSDIGTWDVGVIFNSGSQEQLAATASPSDSEISIAESDYGITPVDELWLSVTGGSAGSGLQGYPLFPSSSYGPPNNPTDFIPESNAFSNQALAMDISGNLWMIGGATNPGAYEVTAPATPYSLYAAATVPAFLVGSQDDSVLNLAIDASDHLWVTNGTEQSLTVYAGQTASTLGSAELPATPEDVAVAPNNTGLGSAGTGEAFVASQSGLQIFQPYHGPGAPVPAVAPSSPPSDVDVTAFDTSGNLWLEDNSGSLYVYQISGDISAPSFNQIAYRFVDGTYGSAMAPTSRGTMWATFGRGEQFYAGEYVLAPCSGDCDFPYEIDSGGQVRPNGYPYGAVVAP